MSKYKTRSRGWGVAALMAVFAVLISGCERRDLNNQEPKKIFKSAIRQKVRSLDPAFASDFFAGVLVARAYDTLYRYNYQARPYMLEPALAASLPNLSKDGLTVSIPLRKGVKFHSDLCFDASGKESKTRDLTARDVVFTLRRLLEPAVGSPGQAILKEYVVDADSVVAADSHTIEIKLKKRFPLLANVLAMPMFSVVAPEAVSRYGAEIGHHPVGTGPFQLKSHTSLQYVWKKNPQYWETGLPHIDELVDDVIDVDQPAWLRFVKGEHDIMNRVPKERMARESFAGKTLLKESAADFTYFAFNLEDPVVGGYTTQKRKLRQAMSLAFDVGPVLDNFYEGFAIKAEFLIPPGIEGYDQKFKNQWGTYNLIKARELLKDAGYPNGEGLPEISLDTPSDTRNRTLAEYFVRAMSELGVKVKMLPAAWPELLSRAQKKQGQIYAVSWVYDYPAAESGLQLLSSASISPGPNKSNYSNRKYDELFDKYRLETSSTKRASLLSKMREIFVQDTPWIIVAHRMETRLLHSWVKNYRLHLFDYNVERYVDVDLQAKP